jgi:bile acid:Na+ symporter, BASS family
VRDTVAAALQHLVDLATPPITLLLLFAVGLELTPGDFREVRKRPGMVAAGVLLPPLLLPPLAITLIQLLDPAPLIASGLLLLVVCPIGGISNAYSALARASLALSVTMTTVSCASAIVTIPAATALLEWLMGHAAPYSAPARTLIVQLFVVIAPSIAAGMAARALRPALVARYRAEIQAVALTLLGLLVVLVIGSAVGRPGIEWVSAIVVVVAFVAVACVLGTAVAWMLGGSSADRFTFAAEFATRNLAIALAVAIALGTQREFVVFGAIYALVEIPVVTGAALMRRQLTSMA